MACLFEGWLVTLLEFFLVLQLTQSFLVTIISFLILGIHLLGSLLGLVLIGQVLKALVEVPETNMRSLNQVKHGLPVVFPFIL